LALRRASLAAVAFALVAGSLPFDAQAQSEVPLAETLYQAARDLMAQGNYAEACPKFAESYRLDPASGTLLNLAACHERQGKLTSAWIEYMDAARAAQRDGRANRLKYAEDHGSALFPKLSRLTITTAPDVDPAHLEITLDGVAVGLATLGVAAPLDPGSHVVVASAAGMQPFTQTVVLGDVADQQVVTIPSLVPAEVAAPPSIPPVAVVAATPPPPAPSPTPKPPASTGLSTPVIVAGSATLALAATTVVTGIVYLNHRANYENATDPAERRAEYDSAQAFGIANVSLLAGTLGGAALTTYFYVTSARSTSRAHLSPRLAPGFAGVVAGSEF
jgi:tetratricopeptide (TPR) repeat protein